MNDVISIKGACVHNLKNISLNIPRNKFVVITGISGSGKSSLAFDTIYAEGQRRYVESLSSYARQFLDLTDKPDVERIDGLSPAISIDQRSTLNNPRSTVGTVTEIYDYLRILFARVGVQHCTKCGKIAIQQSKQQIIRQLQKLPNNTKIILFAPVIHNQKGEHKNVFNELSKAGFMQVRLDGNIIFLEKAQEIKIDKDCKHTIEVIVDQLIIKAKPSANEKFKLEKSLETALDFGNGFVIVNIDFKNEVLFSQHLSCEECNINFPSPEPRSFSFNSPHGACKKCSGLGVKLEVDPDLVIPNKKLTIAEGAIRPWSRSLLFQGSNFKILKEQAKANKFSLNIPVKDLSKQALNMILNGIGNFEGVIPIIMRKYNETDSDYTRQDLETYMRVKQCPFCLGKRLNKESLAVLIDKKNISQITSMSIDEAIKYFNKLSSKKILSKTQMKIARLLFKEIIKRLYFLRNVGLGYITLDRAANTLSGGEAQRIRLATQISSALSGVVYVLDEPSIGLHQKDNIRLIKTLKSLRDIGNTVIVVEHDEETILEADWVIDIGPGAGEHGGYIVAQGTPEQIKKNPNSITGQFLSGKKSVSLSKTQKHKNNKLISIVGAQEFNLKNINVDIPLGKLVAITGVSGSGKSTLMIDILAKSLLKHFYKAKDYPGKHKEIKGFEHVDKIINIDQSPIGKTPRSNPATYTGLFTLIRDLFTEVPEAKIRGYQAGHFSFNVRGGRCESCEGDGVKRIEMNFLPDVYIECEECHGKRYNQEVLEIHYKDKNISDILDMTVEEAYKFFKNIPSIKTKLETLQKVGLGYIHLGQQATTLSGGEAQRVKLATELSRRATGRTLYILDEPTTGLHFVDVDRLLNVLKALVDKGNTVLVIEHNLDVIKSCDWVIDLGPNGGDKGGEIVAQGTPKDIAQIKKSFTGQYLKKVL